MNRDNTDLSKPVKKPKTPPKPIKKSGTIHKKWMKYRRQWKKDNPPDDNGYHYCYICGTPLKPGQITLDHVIPRSRRPDLIFDDTNIRVACWNCNIGKGSQVYK